MKGKKIIQEQALARAAAFESAAEHLLLDWTDDPLEVKEGERVSEWLMAQCNKWEARASEIHAARRIAEKEAA